MEKEWFEQLTDEQKAKLRGMEGDTEKLIAFCREEKLDLPDDLLDAVSGGELRFNLNDCNTLDRGQNI